MRSFLCFAGVAAESDCWEQEESSLLLFFLSVVCAITIASFFYQSNMLDIGRLRFAPYERRARDEQDNRRADATVKVLVETRDKKPKEVGTYSFRARGENSEHRQQTEQQEQPPHGVKSRRLRLSFFRFSRNRRVENEQATCSVKDNKPQACSRVSIPRASSSASSEAPSCSLTTLSSLSDYSIRAYSFDSVPATDDESEDSKRKGSLKIVSQQESLKTPFRVKNQGESRPDKSWLTDKGWCGLRWLFSGLQDPFRLEGEQIKDDWSEDTVPSVAEESQVRFSQVSLHYHTQSLGHEVHSSTGPKSPQRGAPVRHLSGEEEEPHGVPLALDSWFCTRNTTVQEMEAQKTSTTNRSDLRIPPEERKDILVRSGISRRELERYERKMKNQAATAKRGTSRNQNSEVGTRRKALLL